MAALIVLALTMTHAVEQPREGGASSDPATSQGEQLPYAVWVGDSFTEGTGAAETAASYPVLVSRRLGWYPVIDAQGGTGFVADGKTNSPNNVAVPQRLATIHVVPKVVIVDAGRNDGAADFATQITPAVTSYLDAVKVKWPEAKIVLIVPYFLNSPVPVLDFQNLYTEEAARTDAVLVDPMSEGWFNIDKRNELIYQDGVHPSPQGHAYIADKLIDRFKSRGLG